MDAKAASRHNPCKVLERIARCKESSADSPVYKVLRQSGLTLGITISYAHVGNIYRYPYIDPRSLVEHLCIKGHFDKVAGLPVENLEASLTQFWETFRLLHPSHPIYDQYIDMSHCIPYYLHGDGGRGYKKDPVDTFSMLPCLGSGSRHVANKRKHDDGRMDINLRGLSATTRFLFTVLGSLEAKKNPALFDAITELWGQKLQALFADGFQACGETWRIAIIGFTGDSPFVKKVSHSDRSFHNVRKSGFSKKDQKGCCWLCRAGFETQNESIPFEHLGLWNPLWIRTQGSNNTKPWEKEGGPILKYLMLGQDGPAFFRPDFFHVYHSGVGKDFLGSSFVYAMKKLFNCGSVDKDLFALNEYLRRFLKGSKLYLHCGSLSVDTLGYSGTRDYPEGHWSKNADTAVLMRFLVTLLQQEKFSQTVRHDEILSQMLHSAIAMGHFMRRSLQSSYFMPSDDCEYVIQAGHDFLMGYQRLVAACFGAGLCLYKLKPKIHYLNHVVWTIMDQWVSSGTAVNALAEATFLSEDFIGQVARISRRVSPKAVAVKTLQRYDTWVRTALVKDDMSILDLSWLD